MFFIRYLLVFFLAISNSAVALSTPEEEFHLKVTETYSFEPHNLNRDELKIKSDQLDSFWTFVRATPEETLPLLRKELATLSNSAFFFYDGANLLLSMSEKKSDQELALGSISKANLRGIQHTDYLINVHSFAANGFDTRDAAFRILAFPDFQAFIIYHALILGQNYSLIYMLFPMDESIFVNDLAEKLTTETNAQSQKSLLLALWYTVTPEGTAALKHFIENPQNSSELKSYANSLISRKGSNKSNLAPSSEAYLRKQRREVIRRSISDEALEEFESLTLKLLTKQ